MFKDIINKIQNQIDTKKKENEVYKELLQKTTTFQNMFPIPVESKEISEHIVTYITNNCPDLNEEKAKIIAKLIPIDQTYLTIIYTKEILTNQEYYLIATNKLLWIINTKYYKTEEFQNLNIQIIKNNLMSKTLLLNNILLEANGNDNKINNFLNIIINQEYRNQIINTQNNYLCNITPIYQKINNINSGISIDDQKNIVFHTKEWNYKYHITDLKNYEILLDNQSIYAKNSNTSNKITTFQNSCYQISIRITTNDDQNFTIPILEPNAFGNKYQRQDTIFQKNITFAKEIIDKLNSLIPKNY